MADGVMYVEIIPSTKGIGKGITGDLDKQLAGTEKKSQSMFGKVAKWGAVAIGAVGAAVAGLAIAGGISRALNIEDAQAKLRGLGHDAQSVDAIMRDALASVKGTAFGLDAAATTAATAVAAGVEPGRQLERYLRLTADAATIAGVEMGDMGRTFNKVQALGSAFNDSLQVLAEKGLPIYSWLSEEMGVTTEEVKKLASEGKVSSEIFLAAVEDNIAGAALSAGDTTRGAFANMMAAFSRFTAMFAGPGLELAKQFFGEVTELVDGLAERLQPLAQGFTGIIENIDISGLAEGILGALDSIDIGALISGAFTGRATLVEGGIKLVQSLLEGLIAAVPQIVDGALEMVTRILEVIVAQAPAILTAAVELFSGLLDGVIEIIPDLIATIVELIPVIAEALLALVPELITAAVALFMAVVEAIPVIIPLLVEAIIALLPVLIETLFSLIPALIDGALQLFIAIVEAIPIIIPALIDGIINLLPVIITTVIGLIPRLIEAAIQLFTALVEALPKIIPKLIDAVIKIGPKIVEAIIGMIPMLFEAGVALIQGLIDGVMSMFGAIGDAFGGLMDWIGGFFPSSPAERGPFSGYGWIKHGKSGEAFMEQWLSGVESADITGTMTHTLGAASLAGVASAAAPTMPRELVIVDADGQLIGRMQVEADRRISRYDSASVQTIQRGWRPV